MDNAASYIYTFAAIVCVFFFIRRLLNPLNSIPTIGPSAPLLSYIGAFKYVRHGREMLREGYDKYRGSVFKVPMLDQWLVVVSGPKLIDDLRKSPDDHLSFLEGAAELIQSKYTLGAGLDDDPYHVTVIRDKLTRNLAPLLPDVIDEIDVAFNELIPAKEDEWLPIYAMPVMIQLVARASNRIFVGVPKCRDADYLKLAISFTSDVNKARKTINQFPTILKPIVGRMLTRVSNNVRHVTKHLSPIMLERQRKMDELGDNWTEKPNDMLMWLMDEARARGQSFDSVVRRILVVNFAAIHTSSNGVTHALYHLAACPEYIQPLREEAEAIIKAEGWNKIAVGKMWKLDSFMKESQRVNAISSISIVRKALRDVTLSDGTRIPAGTLIAAASEAIHTDEANYAEPHVFNPFRFSDMRQVDGEGAKHQYVNTSVDYISFGHGRHACPGRFFAANELKAMLAYIVLHYDVKFEDEGKRPENVAFGVNVVPALDAQVLFRKRRASATV
ncbi:Ent-kaurene oxidase [Grifola frondosa]|uniref:Ent-kaurene oxidase n=1 Tax=Grifola frondosa TaxID=5627 RepID=A0A1C7MTN5_GRIFR|nr:Ent-kaurene oxidase [Grifola frondosa]